MKDKIEMGSFCLGFGAGWLTLLTVIVITHVMAK